MTDKRMRGSLGLRSFRELDCREASLEGEGKRIRKTPQMRGSCQAILKVFVLGDVLNEGYAKSTRLPT